MEVYLLSIKNSGILYGWWTPIYGVGVLIILFIHNLIGKLKINNILKVILLFICCAIVLGILEGITGYILKEVFDMELWNYTGQALNIGRFASFIMASIWGISSIIYIYVVKRFSDKLVSIIPKSLTIILSILFIADIIITAINKF